MKKLITLFLCSFAFSVNATIVDFDSQPEQYFVPTVIDGDFVFDTKYGDLGTNNNSLWPSNGTTHLMSWTNSGSTSGFTMMSTTGTFDLTSFDFTGGYIGGGSPVSSLVVSGLFDGTLVDSLTFTSGTDFLNFTSYTTLAINFTGIDTLDVQAIGASNRAQFDNFVVNTVTTDVSEPAALFLFAFGLAGIVLSRKRSAVK